jgi:hypothetical protein
MAKNWLTREYPHWDLITIKAQVVSGAMTPDEAEDWARTSGRPPFVRQPDKDWVTQQIAERYWPFALAMAWIATQEGPAAVRLWLSYQAWGPLMFKLEVEFAKAREALLEELRTGKLMASGRPDWRGPHEEAPVIAWQDLHLIRYGGHDRFCRPDGSVAYYDVVVDSQYVSSKWPKLRPVDAKVRLIMANEAEAVRHLTEIMRENPDRPIPKAQLLDRIEGIARRSFERAYAKAVFAANAPAWSAPGRRPKRPEP